ncbi:MAG TPA: hypothetical protein VFS20_12730 [Longimicrobium sp.]|nr:hypothetical protein [Longimicrobium sp.]
MNSVSPRMAVERFFTRRAGAAGLCLFLAGCGDGGSPSGPGPTGPKISLTRVKADFLACTDPCGVRLTYQTRRADTSEPVAATLTIGGDGWHQDRVTTTRPAGQATFTWEYKRPKVSGTTYRLKVCPEVGTCDLVTATVHLPE